MLIGFSLGSNEGDRMDYLRRARDRLFAALDARNGRCSPVYETEPVGVKPEYRDQSFLNAVVTLESDRSADDWLAECARIESELDRRRGEDRYAPRTIDIDLLFVGEEVHEDPHLHVPHPRWMERRFVVQPLADLLPDLTLPGQSRSVSAVLNALPPKPAAVCFQVDW